MSRIAELSQKGKELKQRVEKFGAPYGNKNAAGPHAVARSGGSIGEHKSGDIVTASGKKIVSYHPTPEEAKAKSDRMNKRLTPGERSYYRIKYHPVDLSKDPIRGK